MRCSQEKKAHAGHCYWLVFPIQFLTVPSLRALSASAQLFQSTPRTFHVVFVDVETMSVRCQPLSLYDPPLRRPGSLSSSQQHSICCFGAKKAPTTFALELSSIRTLTETPECWFGTKDDVRTRLNCTQHPSPAKPPSIVQLSRLLPYIPLIHLLLHPTPSTLRITFEKLIIICNVLPRATKKRRYGPVFRVSLRSSYLPLSYLERWHGCIQNFSKAADADEPFLAGSRCCSCYGRYRSRAFGVSIRVQSTRRSPVAICIDEAYRHEESNGASRAAAGAVHKRDAEHIIVHLSATFTRATTLRFG